MNTVHDETRSRTMSVGVICQRDVDTATEGEVVCAAAQRMESRSVGSLVILDPSDKPVGILTDRDIALRVVGEARVPGDTVVGDVMTQLPQTVPQEASVSEALGRMRAMGVRRLPVVDDDGLLAGMLCLDDLLKLHAKEFKSIADLIESTSPTSLSETDV